ncbi:putative S-adenosyl-L-methionine-dependent methyltransferase [Seiridium cardinale]|uniref:S-adenosyl-L-methionine-dependent methyltransferase n=1 Tax=Seiridium cardinale TaxID=138064 RepID=A0ABR2YAG9_9PEZI
MFYLAPFPSRTYSNEQSSRGFCKPATSPASKELAGKRMAGPGPYLAGKREIKNSSMTGSTPKEKIHVKGVEQILLPVVLFKARDSQNPTPILGDPYAKQLLDRCDVDLDATHFSFTTDDCYVTWIANCSKRCGLDCRYFRVEHRPENEVRWIDLDQIMVVDLRNRLIPGPVEGDYALRTLDVTNEGWFRNVPADRPTMIITEGLVPYLEPEQGQKLIHDLVDYFGGPSTETGRKSQLVFDTLGSLSVRLTGYIKAPRTSKAALRWGVDEPERIQELHPRLAFKDRVLWSEYMSSHPPFFGKYGTAAASAMPSSEKNIQL